MIAGSQEWATVTFKIFTSCGVAELRRRAAEVSPCCDVRASRCVDAICSAVAITHNFIIRTPVDRIHEWSDRAIPIVHLYNAHNSLRIASFLVVLIFKNFQQ
jgi:hypothetical protein